MVTHVATRPLTAPLDRLQGVLHGAKNVLVYCHMNPDPDSLGAALAMRLILQQVFHKQSGLCYRGLVGRAENRQLVELVAPDMQRARDVDQKGWDAAFLVDAQPDFGYLHDVDKLPLLGCVDHHPWAETTAALPYHDVRQGYGATCTVMVEYLQAFGIEPPAAVATALYYGIKSDTMDLSRRTSEVDMAAYEWLFRRVDRELLNRIQNPPLRAAYFEDLRKAIGRATVYDHIVLTELGHVQYPDMVAEIADRILRLDNMQWSVCFGSHEKRIYLSVRTNLIDGDAGKIVKAVLRNDGLGGGHMSMAAGRVELPVDSKEAYLERVAELWRRFLEELGERTSRGRPLLGTEAPTQRIKLPRPH